MSLKNKLILLFVAFTLITLVSFGSLVFSRMRNILETVRIAQLNTLVDLKKDKIETFFREREADARSAQYFRNIRKNLPVLIRHPAERPDPVYATARQELDDQLTAYQQSLEYLNVILTDPQGAVIYESNRGRDSTRLPMLRENHTLAEARKHIYFSDIFPCESNDCAFEMLVVAPVHDLHDRFTGLVALEIDMDPIFAFIRDTTGLGASGEALIVRKTGDNLQFLSPLLHDPQAPLKRTVSLHEKIAIPAQLAVRGERGSGVVADYRGEEVLAAWRYLPALRWGLVTKIDADEVFAPVHELRVLLIFAGLLITVIGALAAVAIARTITRPVLALQKGAAAVAEGNLSLRLGTPARDEIGLLAQSFDAMTAALQQDIDRRETAEREIRKLNSDLERHVLRLEDANREMEAFSYSVSHDLRAPLRSIDGFSLALLEDYADRLDAEGRDNLARVRAATQRMGQLIDDLLKLSRVTRMDMCRTKVDLSAIARSIIATLQTRQPDRTAAIVIAGGLAAEGDGPLLTILLENVLSNAWKFVEKSVHPAIEFGSVSKDGQPIFFVRDNGAGFDMAYADKLFRPFQRLHRETDFPGTGIGLATVKRIVTRHHGRVWIESEPDKGTTLYFTLAENACATATAGNGEQP